MNSLAIVTIIWGIVAIALKGPPVIIAPDKMREFADKILSSDNRVRILGVLFSPLIIATIITAGNHEHPAAKYIMYIGWFYVPVITIGLLAFPSIYRRIAESMLGALDPIPMRLLGVLSTGIGIFFIWAGLAVFNQ